MVDVFISYAKTDRALVEKVEAALNVAGFTTWWDKRLTSGEDFGPTIDSHLAQARAVVCLWTQTSIKSQWVRAEAAKANSATKLIPVKVADVGYAEIPPPFNVLDTASIEDSGRIVEAVKALLTRPAEAPGRWFLARARTRQEILSWVGILGAVLTVSANLRGLLDIARWAKWLLAHWLDVVAWFWKTVLFFLPRLTVDDASLLAIILFLSINVATCMRRGKPHNSFGVTLESFGLAAVLVGSIYWSAFDRALSESEPGLTGRVFDWLWLRLFAPPFGVDTANSIYPEGSDLKVLAASLAVLSLGLLVLLAAALVVMRALRVHVDTRLLRRRFMRIIAGVGVLGIVSWAYDVAEKVMTGA